MTDPNAPLPGFKHLTAAAKARIAPDLDLTAVDDLLAALPHEAWPVILERLGEPVPPPGTRGEWAVSQRLGHDDPRIAALLDRVYKEREKR